MLPKTWEERLTLYVGYLTDRGLQSRTIKSYISAIKSVLIDDDYEWNENKLKLTALTQACRLQNDEVRTRLPIQAQLMEILLYEIARIEEIADQVYLICTYRCIILILYYGLFRIGEVTLSPHALKARDIHINDEKTKMLLVLRSSKTHSKANKPQNIKLTSNMIGSKKFCPVKYLNKFLELRGGYKSIDEQLFIFRDGTPVKANHVRVILRKTLSSIGLNADFYGTHSFRSGRATDLTKFGFSVDDVKRLGRWSSNAVYNYIRN